MYFTFDFFTFINSLLVGVNRNIIVHIRTRHTLFYNFCHVIYINTHQDVIIFHWLVYESAIVDYSCYIFRTKQTNLYNVTFNLVSFKTRAEYSSIVAYANTNPKVIIIQVQTFLYGIYLHTDLYLFFYKTGHYIIYTHNLCTLYLHIILPRRFINTDN